MRDDLYKQRLAHVFDFSFGEEVALVFDDMVRRSIPFYSELQRMVAEISLEFLQEGGVLYDVGCSTGTTIAAVLSALDQSSQVRLVGIEPSPAMKKKAHAKLAPLEGSDRVTLLSDNIEDFESLPDASVIVFLFTMQFVRPINRQRVLDLCWHSLKAGGCLILAEKVLADDSMLSRTYIEFYHAFKKRSGYSKNEISRKREALENVLIPYRDGENKKMLLDAGFRVVDRFFRWYNFAAYLAVKS